MEKRESASATEFARLLTEGVYAIKGKEQGKTLQRIQEELGDALGRESGKSSIEHWRKGNVPFDKGEVAVLMREIMARGDMGAEWAAAFLYHGRYPNADALLSELFPFVSETAEEPQPIAQAPIESNTVKRWWGIAVSLIVMTLLVTAIVLFPFPKTVEQQTSLLNSGFEQNLEAWQTDSGCQPAIWQSVEDAQIARTGSRFAEMAVESQDCYSFAQTVSFHITETTTFRASAWVRSGDGNIKQAELRLWTGKQPEGTDGFGYNEYENSSPAKFKIYGSQWQCIETAVTLPPTTTNDQIRVELYFDTLDGSSYYIDNIEFQETHHPLCPPINTTLLSEYWQQPSAWLFEGEGCDFVPQPQQLNNESALLIPLKTTCLSMYHDLPLTASNTITDTIHHWQIWLKLADDTPPLRVETVLWGDEGRNNSQVKYITAEEWTCLENTYQLHPQDKNLRTQLYWHGLENPTDVYISQAELKASPSAPRTTCPQDNVLLANPTFAYGLANWQTTGTCQTKVAKDETDNLLQIDYNLECGSLYQDTLSIPEKAPAYYLTAWIRTAEPTTANAELVIWTQGGEEAIKANAKHTLQGTEWQCLTTKLNTENIADFNHLRAELYLQTSGVSYLIREMQLSTMPNEACALPDLEIQSVTLLHRNSYPDGIAELVLQVRNVGRAVSGANKARIWLAIPDNLGIQEGLTHAIVEIPTLEPNESTAVIRTPLHLEPNALPPGSYTVTVAIDHDQQIYELNEQNNIDTRPITLSTCATDSQFCDMPLSAWGNQEAVQWLVNGITNGCGESPTGQKLFCPELTVTKDVFSIFLVRHLISTTAGDESSTYQGYFTDVPESRQWATWIETPYTLGYELNDSCTDQTPELDFCPDHYITHNDMARYLADILEWELQPIRGNIFEDVNLTTNGRTAQAAEYMAQNGIILPNDRHCFGQDNSFCGDHLLTRATAAVWMTRAFSITENNSDG